MRVVDPLDGNLLLEVCDLGERQQLRLANVVAVHSLTLKGDHLVSDAGDGVLHRGTTGHDGLFDIGLACEVCAAALEQRQLNAAHLRAGLFLHDARQQRGEAAELRVAKAVRRAGLGLGDKAAIGIVDALGYGDHAAAGLLVDALDVGKERVHVEISLGQVDEVGTRAVLRRERGGGGQPTGVAAHDLDNADHARVVDVRVLIDLHQARRDVLGGAGVAGAVVGAIKVVVDRLGHAHDAALVADLLHVLADLIAGIHRVISAVVEEIADVVLFKYLEDALVIGVVLVGVLHLVAAGAEGGGGGVL